MIGLFYASHKIIDKIYWSAMSVWRVLELKTPWKSVTHRNMRILKGFSVFKK